MGRFWRPGARFRIRSGHFWMEGQSAGRQVQVPSISEVTWRGYRASLVLVAIRSGTPCRQVGTYQWAPAAVSGPHAGSMASRFVEQLLRGSVCIVARCLLARPCARYVQAAGPRAWSLTTLFYELAGRMSRPVSIERLVAGRLAMMLSQLWWVTGSRGLVGWLGKEIARLLACACR